MSKISILIYRLVYKLYIWKIPIIPEIINKLFLRILFGCQIGTGAKLGQNVNLGYGGLGIVIHPRVVIGNSVSIGTGVTIGGTSGKFDVPKIGSNTIISTGAKVIGAVRIGTGCVIGANAVVVTDIPNNSLVVGIPARVIKQNINVSDYK